jgi:hypothetical protein
MKTTIARWQTLAAILALPACTTPAPEIPVAEVEYSREILVQTIPRGAYIERNAEYIGVAPILVKVETTESGRPLRRTRITATHTPTGANVWKALMPGDVVPEKMLLDIRPFLEPTPTLTF